jgi:predicted metalloendopeptidase
VHAAATFLSKPFVDESFDMYDRTITGKISRWIAENAASMQLLAA